MTAPSDPTDTPDSGGQTLGQAADLPQDIAVEEIVETGGLDEDAYVETDDADEADDAGEPAPAPVFASIDRPIQTVGRRKEAVVRVRLVPGSGRMIMNKKPFEEYFPNKVHQQLIRQPLVDTERTEQFDVYATLHGGGTSGQAGALRLALARALVEVDPDDRPGLKKSGFLTRDARATERKKYGLKKARKAPQYSKR